MFDLPTIKILTNSQVVSDQPPCMHLDLVWYGFAPKHQSTLVFITVHWRTWSFRVEKLQLISSRHNTKNSVFGVVPGIIVIGSGLNYRNLCYICIKTYLELLHILPISSWKKQFLNSDQPWHWYMTQGFGGNRSRNPIIFPSNIQCSSECKMHLLQTKWCN
jgi:hypothetical protein